MPAMDALLGLAQGHPQPAMLLAHALWDQTPRGEGATPETLAGSDDGET